MDWLNYHHLLYFWVITQEGSLTAAASRLRLTHSTLSTQLKALEDFLGQPLFERRGRRLVLTSFGQQVAGYAADIFRTGAELVEVARGTSGGKRLPFRVGVMGSIPRSVAHRLLEPALRLAELRPLQLQQQELPRLTEELAVGRLDLVLADTPSTASAFRTHAHLLGSTEVLLFGSKELAARYGKRFPAGLEGAPFLLPASGELRRSIERWLAAHGLRVKVDGEFDDVGLLRVFGGRGLGVFPVRAMLRTEVEEAHGAKLLGPLTGVRQSFWALSLERKIRHRGVVAVVEAARATMAGGG